MAIDADRLDALIHAFVRDRADQLALKIYELLRNELRDADNVLLAKADDGSRALLLVSDDHEISLCRLDEGGRAFATGGL